MPKTVFKYFALEYISWLVFFALCRSIFLIYNLDEIKSISFFETLSTYKHALYLDTSAASYFLIISFLFLFLYSLAPRPIFLKMNTIYVIIVMVCLSFIAIAEIEIYNEWGTKITIKAIRFLKTPTEVIGSVRTSFLLLGLLSVGILTFVGFFIRKKIISIKTTDQPERNIVFSIVLLLIIPVFLALGIRGGVQQIPIQQSDAYFSKHNILNLAAIHSGWNLIHSVIENNKVMDGNPFIFYSDVEAKEIINKIHSPEKDTTINVLTTDKPNIVMVVLESWSADLIASLNGYKDVTPGFDTLAKTGILFTNIYGSGTASDQGMAALFSAFPAQPSTSIISQPSKYIHLPCINQDIKKIGYTTSFLFGGQLSYGNIKAYMYYNNFDRIQEGVDFDSDLPQGKLGVHDEYLYAKQIQNLKNEKQPFFAAMFTLSSHSPFDMPMQQVFDWGGDENKYVNSVHYADKELYKFIQNAKKESWFNNTLFVFVADHSHRSPKHWDFNQPEYRKIPMLFWGNVIKPEFRGYRYEKSCSQVDLAATLLNQLNINAERFHWSKNLFNPYSQSFAFYEVYSGFGWLRDNQYVLYGHNEKRIFREQVNSEEEKLKLEKEGKAYLQELMTEYDNF